jgi:hypothetical protein
MKRVRCLLAGCGLCALAFALGFPLLGGDGQVGLPVSPEEARTISGGACDQVICNYGCQYLIYFCTGGQAGWGYCIGGSANSSQVGSNICAAQLNDTGCYALGDRGCGGK